MARDSSGGAPTRLALGDPITGNQNVEAGEQAGGKIGFGLAGRGPGDQGKPLSSVADRPNQFLSPREQGRPRQGSKDLFLVLEGLPDLLLGKSQPLFGQDGFQGHLAFLSFPFQDFLS